MKRTILIVLLICFSGLAQAQSEPSTSVGLPIISEMDLVEKNGTFGGIAVNIGSGNISNTTGDLPSSSWPAIAEVYTATWCENCLDSEHAVSELATNRLIESLHYHREYSEIRDPFGTEVGDDRWIERFGPTNIRATGGLERLPPAVVFNGEWLHSGSVPKGSGTLSDDYSLSVDLGSSLSLEGMTASLTWTDIDGTNGTVDWNLLSSGALTMEDIWNDDCSNPTSASITPILYVVEELARDENGSNGLEYYPHVIRDIHILSEDGTSNIALPEVWDGEDLRLVLAFDWEMNFIQIDCDDNDSGFLPSISAVSTLLILSLASIVIRKK